MLNVSSIKNFHAQMIHTYMIYNIYDGAIGDINIRKLTDQDVHGSEGMVGPGA